MRPPTALEARSRPRVHARIREERPRRSDAQGALLRRSVVVVQGRLVHPSPPRRVWPPRRFPGDRFPIWKMIGKLADQAHPATRLRGLMERASKCTDVRARQVHTDTATSQCAGLLGRRATKVTFLRFETTGRCKSAIFAPC